MITFETSIAFMLAATLLTVAPGPDNVFVLTQSALYGKSSGLFVTFGLCTGLLVHTAAVAFGVAAILQASALAFILLKISGAFYLLYLSWKMFRAKPQYIEMGLNAQKRSWQLYRRGIIMNITNPKVTIFFLAFLPQFVDPQRGTVSVQLITLGGIFILSTMLVFGLVALVGGSLGNYLNRSPRAQRIMNRVAGTVFVVLALKLLTTEG